MCSARLLELHGRCRSKIKSRGVTRARSGFSFLACFSDLSTKSVDKSGGKACPRCQGLDPSGPLSRCSPFEQRRSFHRAGKRATKTGAIRHFCAITARTSQVLAIKFKKALSIEARRCWATGHGPARGRDLDCSIDSFQLPRRTKRGPSHAPCQPWAVGRHPWVGPCQRTQDWHQARRQAPTAWEVGAKALTWKARICLRSEPASAPGARQEAIHLARDASPQAIARAQGP